MLTGDVQRGYECPYWAGSLRKGQAVPGGSVLFWGLMGAAMNEVV